jgi:hypothetical protein
MNGWLVALIVLTPLLAFGMWLTFNAILARWYGLDALKATPPVYQVFAPREWFTRSPHPDSRAGREPASGVRGRAGDAGEPAQDPLP